MQNSVIKVLIVDDSIVFTRFLTDNLPKANPHVQIVGYAMNAYEALQKIPRLKPDVITLDIEMPKMSGMEFLKELLPKYPLPVILVSSLNVSVFDALSSGAVDFVKKPDMSLHYGTNAFLASLSSKIYIASRAKVRLSGAAKPSTQPVSNSASNTTANAASTPSGSVLGKLTGSSLKLNMELIALGASTGGTEATLQVLQQLPADIPGIIVTQHMPEGFTGMYAERLNRLCKMQVREAVNGDRIQRGLVLIAPGGDLQTKVVRSGPNYLVKCYPGDKVNGHRPSVDVLFYSVAAAAQSNAVGIILTGMGGDGAEGLLAMRKAGAYTIGQDRESCVVYGMPMVAHKLGAVAIQSSAANIPGVLLKYLNTL